jgi:hypothetical protein
MQTLDGRDEQMRRELNAMLKSNPLTGKGGWINPHTNRFKSLEEMKQWHQKNWGRREIHASANFGHHISWRVPFEEVVVDGLVHGLWEKLEPLSVEFLREMRRKSVAWEQEYLSGEESARRASARLRNLRAREEKGKERLAKALRDMEGLREMVGDEEGQVQLPGRASGPRNLRLNLRLHRTHPMQTRSQSAAAAMRAREAARREELQGVSEARVQRVRQKLRQVQLEIENQERQRLRIREDSPETRRRNFINPWTGVDWREIGSRHATYGYGHVYRSLMEGTAIEEGM